MKRIQQVAFLIGVCCFFHQPVFAVKPDWQCVHRQMMENGKNPPVSTANYEAGQAVKGLKEGFAKRFLEKKIVRMMEKKMDKIAKKGRDGWLADNRVYFGLILLLGGLLVVILLPGFIDWIGSIAMLAGLILLVWALVDRAR